jgi:hypothetical protein
MRQGPNKSKYFCCRTVIILVGPIQSYDKRSKARDLWVPVLESRYLEEQALVRCGGAALPIE